MNLKITLTSFLIALSLFLKVGAQHTHADWSKHVIANEDCAFNNILFDGESIIVNGYWFLNAEYDGISLPYYTSSNALIAKKDLDGNIIWHTTMVGEGYETFFSMALDSDKNIVAVGWSSSNDTIRINGEVVYVPDMEWTSRGIVAKFSGVDGSLMWYKPILPNQEYYNMSITQVAVDEADNIYISGYANTSFSIDSIDFFYTQTGWGTQTFIAKLDPEGMALWGVNFNFINEGDPGWSTARALTLKNNDIFLAIEYSKPIIIGDTILPYVGQGWYDWIAIARLSTESPQVSKAIAFGSSMNQNITRLKHDKHGNLVAAGFFESGSEFSIAGNQPMAYGYEDAYVAKFTDNLELIWLKSMGSEFASRAFNLNIDHENRIFIGGGFDSFTPFYFQGHRVIEMQSPNSLGMFQVIVDEDGEFEKAFALHGAGIESRLDYRDAVVLDNDQIYALGASIDYVEFIEDSVFFSLHDAGFFMKWDLSKAFYKATFIVKDEEGNYLDNATITFGTATNPPNWYSFYQIESGIYDYSVALAGYHTVQDEVEVSDQNVTVQITMIISTVSANSIPVASFSLYPNPASSYFSVVMETPIDNIMITDMKGRVVKNQHIGSNIAKIGLNGFPDGLYMVIVRTRDGVKVNRIQVTK
jgi:hypothetical protein